MTDLNVTGLRVLREVAAQGSFTAAAKTLGYTQSAVSRQVAGLEGAAGTPLFDRSARGVHLTDAGETLLQRARTVLDELDAAQRELAGIAQPATGRLGVGAFPTAMAALVPRALADFRARHPTVRIGLREGITSSQVERLLSGAVDVAVIGALPGWEVRDRRISLEHLIDDPLLLAVGREHPLARRRSVEIDDLAEESWIAGSAKASDSLLGPWQWAEWRPRVSVIAKEWTGKLGLVAAGLGITLVPGLAASAVRRDIALVRIRSSERPASRDVSIATRPGEGAPPFVGPFADLLHQTATRMASELQSRIRGR
jgi:DNA-binding transcriptional LysR family regulator